MTAKRTLAVMVLIETDDPRLFPENIDVSSAAKTAALRAAVVRNLPDVRRVVMVTSENEAMLMCYAHEEAMKQVGLRRLHPPSDYVPPTCD